MYKIYRNVRKQKTNSYRYYIKTLSFFSSTTDYEKVLRRTEIVVELKKLSVLVLKKLLNYNLVYMVISKPGIDVLLQGTERKYRFTESNPPK